MSEEILRAIIELLAIVAKEDEVTSDERASIQHFLEENLTQEASIRFLALFDELVHATHGDNEETHIAQICSRINTEQTSQQKVIIILNLLIVINADGRISERENKLLYTISAHLNIDKRITDLIKAFVIYQERSKISSRNLMIVDNGDLVVPEKCQRTIRPHLNGFLLILRVPNEEVYLAKYIGEHNPMLNDAPMRTNRIYNMASGSSIKFESSDPLYHSEVVNRFRQIAAEHHLTFVADQVGFKFKNGNIGLRNINIQEEGGQLIALMGGSGAGKSTLLNVLNGNETPSEGSVRINGVDIHVSPQKIDGVIGYVPQDDLLIEELTVFDNLYYAAKLCFKDLSNQEISDLVNKTLESLGLYETRHLKVGSPLEKTISGGQRKRLNIGLELLREPSLLFVDEPTSGLSSRDSENIMDLLKELSLKGKMIFVVIHQPSEDIFKMFDKLIVLDVGGYQVYYGNPVEGISYFKNIVKMVDQARTANPEQIFNIIESKVVNEFGNFTKDRKTTPEQWHKHFEEKIKLPTIKETDVVPHKTLHLPGHIKQLAIFTIRDLKSKLSNKQYLLINLLEAPVLALLLSFIIRYMPEDTTTYHFSDNLNIPVFFFMSVIVSLFMGLTVSAEEIIKDRKILKREAFLHLSRSSYLYSKLIILFSISAFQTATYLALGHWILGIQGMFLPFWLVLFSTSCFANLLGLNISAAFKSAVTVYILIPLLVIPQLILSGVVVNFDKLNPTITTEDKVPMIGEVMASRWAFEALAVHQFKNNAYGALFYPQEKRMAESEFKTVYTFPRLESELEYIHHNIAGADDAERAQIAYKLTTLRNELNKELSKIGVDKFPQVDQLTLSGWTDQLFDETKEFIAKLNTYYNLRFKKANKTKQEILKEWTSTPEQRAAFEELKNDHHNEAVATLVKNVATAHRILEHNNELIQKLYPIYHDPEFPAHFLDVRAQFYQPQKHIAGIYIDTLYFNVLVIWLMSTFLFVALYFDWLRKIVN